MSIMGLAVSFFSPFSHGFLRVATATPRCHIADPARNAYETFDLARQADAAHADLVVFPELGLSAYSNDDLFLQDALHDAVEDALLRIVEESRTLHPVLIVGAPRLVRGRLFNLAIAIHRGSNSMTACQRARFSGGRTPGSAW